MERHTVSSLMMIMRIVNIVLIPLGKVMFSFIIFFSLPVHNFLLCPWLAKRHTHKGIERKQLLRQDFVFQAVESISLVSSVACS